MFSFCLLLLILITLVSALDSSSMLTADQIQTTTETTTETVTFTNSATETTTFTEATTYTSTIVVDTTYTTYIVATTVYAFTSWITTTTSTASCTVSRTTTEVQMTAETTTSTLTATESIVILGRDLWICLIIMTLLAGFLLGWAFGSSHSKALVAIPVALITGSGAATALLGWDCFVLGIVLAISFLSTAAIGCKVHSRKKPASGSEMPVQQPSTFET